MITLSPLFADRPSKPSPWVDPVESAAIRQVWATAGTGPDRIGNLGRWTPRFGFRFNADAIRQFRREGTIR